eukprot:TRINITY_DN102592_c0_g1_i1.p1 TRINITY_DN102592_c0_g1~~TRINITY_DN102592_c0_g1_i1.p1  ORF type:complete len:887 (+),score=95.26 TRINITY_DN102592_c0_g1_i1:71-2731(+)
MGCLHSRVSPSSRIDAKQKYQLSTSFDHEDATPLPSLLNSDSRELLVLPESETKYACVQPQDCDSTVVAIETNEGNTTEPVCTEAEWSSLGERLACGISVSSLLIASVASIRLWQIDLNEGQQLQLGLALCRGHFKELFLAVGSIVCLVLSFRALPLLCMTLLKYALIECAVTTVAASANRTIEMVFSPTTRAARGRIFLLLVYAGIQIDQGLDGLVMVDYIQDRFFVWVLVNFLLMLVPQLVIWAFLHLNGITNVYGLGYITCFPSIFLATLCVTMSLPQEMTPQWVHSASGFFASLSIGPLREVVRCWNHGEASAAMSWFGIGEGLLEASTTGVFTLYVLLTHGRMSDLLFVGSVMWSWIAATKAAVTLHYYGQKHVSWQDMVGHATLVIFPRTVSRMTSIAFAAYIAQPDGNLFFVCMLVSLFMCNVAIIYLINGDIPKPIIALFGLVMILVGPPGFLSSLDRVHLPQALLQYSFLAITALHFSPSISQCVEELWVEYRIFAIAWVLATPWSFMHCLRTLQTGSSLAEQVSMTHNKLHMAAHAGDRILCRLLIDVERADPAVASTWVLPRTIPTGRTGGGKWHGIIALEDIFYCAPRNDEAVLVINPKTHSTSFISTGRSSVDKWQGIAAYGGKLYCAPLNEDDVLVIEPTGTISYMATGRRGPYKWQDIVVHRDKLYCAPCDQDDVLVIDPVAGTTSFIPTGRSGGEKWHGIAAFGDKLYCAPANEKDVLVIDPLAGTISFIATGRCGSETWHGISAGGNKLYCAPRNEDDILVIHPEPGTVSFISTSRHGSDKWGGIAALHDKLYCAPYDDEDVLVIDPAADTASFICTGRSGGRKWRSIAASGASLCCAPYHECDVLIDADNIPDERHLLEKLGLGEHGS